MDSVSYFWPKFLGQVVFVLDDDDKNRKNVYIIEEFMKDHKV